VVDTAKKRERRAALLCTDCGKDVVPGRTKCAKHLQGNTVAVQKYVPRYRKQLKEESRCLSCARLLTELDTGHVRCMNCRQNVFVNRW